MKKHLFFFIFIVGFLYSGYCSNDSITSKIIIFRENSFYASGVSYKVFVNNALIVRLKNNSYFVYNCKPGEYSFVINKLKDTYLKIEVEEGKAYYLRLGINMGFLSVKPELLLLDSATASMRIKSGNLHKLGSIQLPYFRPPNRIGINMAIGGGFENFTMFKTTEGDDSKISFGGGYAIGLKYGYEVNKHFDLALDINYQFSMLQPFLKNAKTTFRRGYLSITPSYIIPLNDGEFMRFKIGGGYNYYWDAQLIIEGSKIPSGFNDTWIYDAASGFHISVNFEMNMNEKFSMSYGLKYYSIHYNFKSGSVSYPLDNFLIKPDGSGLDLMMGFYYHF